MWDCWTTCFSVGRSREDYVGQCVVGTVVVGGIGSGGDGSERDCRCCEVMLPSNAMTRVVLGAARSETTRRK